MTLEAAFLPLIQLALQEDFGSLGDVTSQAIMPRTQAICGRITAKGAGIVAGLEAVALVYQQIDPTVVVQTCVKDGTAVEAGTVICEVQGTATAILSGERVALNFLQRLSGIASLTRRFVNAVAGTHAILLDTRKTTPGWRDLEKYAVRMGGGQNHRMGLFDMVLIKDNHIDAAGSITAAVEAARRYAAARLLPIEVEVKDEAELREALALHVDRILLDNMTPQQMQQAVVVAGGSTPLEASGNVNLATVRAIAETGVDYISVGALTHSAPVLDLSMRLVPQVQPVQEMM